MQFDSLKTVFITLAFFVPGFLWHRTYSLVIPSRTAQSKLVMIHILTLSCANYALWCWLVYLLLVHPVFLTNVFLTAFVWLFIVLLSPCMLGVLSAYIQKKNVIRRVLRKFGLNGIHPVDTAWDYKFSETRTPRYVIIVLNNGQELRGYYGGCSFASSWDGDRDVYIEKAYKAGDRGSWETISRTDGMLIRADSIQRIEFFTND